MSLAKIPQQINLFNPALCQRRDWLSLSLVLWLCLLALLGEAVAYGVTRYQREQLAASENSLAEELKATQSSVQMLEKALAERKPNAALAQELEAQKAALAPREGVVEKLKQVGGEGFSEILRGFARQTLEGVWLTELAANGPDLLIRGRLLDPALLPTYIARLNADPAFRGRQFASLNMKEVEVLPEKALPGAGMPAAAPAALVPNATPLPVAKPTPAAPPVKKYYVEFALQGDLVVAAASPIAPVAAVNAASVGATDANVAGNAAVAAVLAAVKAAGSK